MRDWHSILTPIEATVDIFKELKQKGFKAEKFGTIGNLHAVSYSSFSDKEKATKELERIRKDVAPEAWMIYH